VSGSHRGLLLDFMTTALAREALAGLATSALLMLRVSAAILQSKVKVVHL